MTLPAQRVTKQRVAVLEALAHSDAFRTAQQIFDELRGAGHSIGLATVYRTLQTLTEIGGVDVVRTPDGELSYRQCRTKEHHHHLVCRKCGKSAVVSGALIEKWAEAVATEYGYTQVDHDLEFFGLCPQCS